MADKDHALPMYQRALDANAGYDEIYFNRATVYAETGKTDEAKWNYRMAIAINPLSHDAYNALGSIYLKDLERYGADVQALYEQATRAFPNDRDLWNNLGYVYTKRQEWQDAYRAYRRALEISPDFTLAWQNLRAIAPHITGAKDDVFLKQGQIFPQAEQLMAARHFAEARQLLAPLEAAAPGSFRAHFDLGNAYFGLHDLDHAVAEFTAAAQLKGDSPSVWQNLGVAEEQAGKKDEARAAFEKVLQLDPKNEAVRQHLGQLH